jgi:hypothetical protein
MGVVCSLSSPATRLRLIRLEANSQASNSRAGVRSTGRATPMCWPNSQTEFRDMKFGFTGTRQGMTRAQGASLRNFFEALPSRPDESHHGCCVGADAEFADMLARNCWGEVHGHPPRSRSLVDAQAEADADILHPPLEFLERNRAIADATDVLLAAPAEAKEQQRGGTWSTVRYARRKCKRVVLFLPDGTVKDSGEVSK